MHLVKYVPSYLFGYIIRMNQFLSFHWIALQKYLQSSRDTYIWKTFYNVLIILKYKCGYKFQILSILLIFKAERFPGESIEYHTWIGKQLLQYD